MSFFNNHTEAVVVVQGLEFLSAIPHRIKKSIFLIKKNIMGTSINTHSTN